MLTSYYFKMRFSFSSVSNIAITTMKFVNKVGGKIWYKRMEALNLNKLLNRFLDWKITIISHRGNDLLTHLYKRFLKVKENVPKNGRTTNNSSWIFTFNGKIYIFMLRFHVIDTKFYIFFRFKQNKKYRRRNVSKLQV